MRPDSLPNYKLIALRVEWCKARARAERWYEEIVLLNEEMRRSVMYFRWKSRDWEGRRDSTINNDEVSRAGLRAYALQQADMFFNMARVFEDSWKEVRAKAMLVVENEDFLEEEIQDQAVGSVDEDVDEALEVEDTERLSWEVDAWDVAGGDDI